MSYINLEVTNLLTIDNTMKVKDSQNGQYGYVAITATNGPDTNNPIATLTLSDLWVTDQLSITAPNNGWITLKGIDLGKGPIVQISQAVMTKSDLIVYGLINTSTNPTKLWGGGGIAIGYGWVGHPQGGSPPLIWLTGASEPYQSGNSFPSSVITADAGELFNLTATWSGYSPGYYLWNGSNWILQPSASGFYDTLFLVQYNSSGIESPAHLDLGNLTAHGGMTVNGTITLSGIPMMNFQECPGDYLVKGSRGHPALTNATMTRVWLEIDDASLVEGTTGPGASIQFNNNATNYWEIINSVYCAASCIPASDNLEFWYDGPNPGSKFAIYGNGAVWTMHNKIDDGSGNMTVSGAVYVDSGHFVSMSSNSNMCFDGGSSANFYWRCNYNLPQLNNFTTTMTLTPWGDLYIIGSYYSWSSQRNKTNIISMPDASWIYNLRPVTFDWTDPKRATALGRTMGLIAEEVYTINPQLSKARR